MKEQPSAAWTPADRSAALAFVVQQMKTHVGVDFCHNSASATQVLTWADRLNLLLTSEPSALELRRPYVLQQSEAPIIRVENWWLRAGFEVLIEQRGCVHPYVVPATASRVYLCGEMPADLEKVGKPRTVDRAGLTLAEGRVLTDRHFRFLVGDPHPEYAAWVQAQTGSPIDLSNPVTFLPVTADNLTAELFRQWAGQTALTGDLQEHVRAVVGRQETDITVLRYGGKLSLRTEAICWQGEKTNQSASDGHDTVSGAMELVRGWLAGYIERKLATQPPADDDD